MNQESIVESAIQPRRWLSGAGISPHRLNPVSKASAMKLELDSIVLIASADKTLSFSKSSYKQFRRLLATVGGNLDESNSDVVLQAVDFLLYSNSDWSVSVRSVIAELQDQQLAFDEFELEVIAG